MATSSMPKWSRRSSLPESTGKDLDHESRRGLVSCVHRCGGKTLPADAAERRLLMKFQSSCTPFHIALLLALLGLVIGTALPCLSTGVTALAERPDSGSISSTSGQENPLSLNSLNRWSSNGPDGG